VSIGLAVYNGERHLAAAIDSILAQTFTDFELIISDNASTDATQDIARRAADGDPRIRYYRNATNIGGANNEYRTFELSRGKYFRLAADDDLCAPRLIEACVEVLERRPDVVLCYSHTIEIDENGDETGRVELDRGTAETPSARLSELAFRNHRCEPTYGLMRADVIRSTGLQHNYTDSDRVWLCQLAMRGRFAVVEQPLFFKRYHARNEYLDWRARMAWFVPGREQRIAVPNWLALFDHVRTIVTAPITTAERMRCAAVIARWAITYARSLFKDVAVSILGLARVRSIAPQQAQNWEG
jgi:glycosyltransferase involved in cell wall biosynthesis